MFSTVFDAVWVRFCLAGTLVTAFWVTDLFARRAGVARPGTAAPRWVKPVILCSVLGFYALIGPTGGALFAGVGNVAGIALAMLACVARLRQTVRYPDLGARSLFYLALPLAVGAPSGLLALTLPALATSFYCCHRAERAVGTTPEGVGAAGPRYRLIDRVW